MKYKILSVLIITCLILSGISVVGIELEEETNTQKIDIYKINFSKKSITPIGEYLSLNIDGTDTFLMSPRKPMLPIYVEKYTFPFGTKIKSIDCIQLSNIKQETISGKIKPAPQSIPLIYQEINTNNDTVEKIVEDATVYNSPELYPDKWYDYNIGCGLDGDEHVVILTIHYYPVRYSPLENTIYYVDGVDIKISYEEPPEDPIPRAKQYDLVVISPRRFSLRLRPLVMHKKISGIKTTLKTTESIYRNFEGRDKPEQIKYFIKYAVEEWGVKYVLLVGGMKSLISGTPRDNLNEGSKSWFVPVRYSNLVDPWGIRDPGYISDLYYADIYKYNESSEEYEFDDWDSNGNWKFAEWTWKNQDILDLYPDVYIGRLACKNILEVRNVVNKIIKYETTTYGQEWFKKMIVAGGDTVPPDNGGTPGIYEGERENERAAEFMEPLEFNITKLWTSSGTLKGPDDTINAINNGSAGFLFFSGHGSPFVWSTYLPDEPDPNNYIDGLWNIDMGLLNNSGKYPICVVGGCHNSQFNVGLPNMLKGLLRYRLRYFIFAYTRNCFGKMAWVSNTWSWKLINQKNSGTIATIGNSGLGWGDSDESCIDGLDGWITTHFFKTYAELYNQENCTLGMVHSKTISDFIETFTPNDEMLERKTVEQWVLLGDSTLKIGGYPN